MSRFANLADRPTLTSNDASTENGVRRTSASFGATTPVPTSPSRVGRKAIAAYFSPDMSMAMHVCARMNGLSLQQLMAEAFNDVLRKYGQSPIGK